MRLNKLKLIIVASLLGLMLGITGCSTTPYQEHPSEKRGESASSPIESDVLIPRKKEGSDDMERLD